MVGPATGTTVTTATMYLMPSINGAAYSTSTFALKVTDAGVFTLPSTGSIVIASNTLLFGNGTQGFGLAGGQPAIYGASSVIKWQLDGANWIPETNDTNDIGESGQLIKHAWVGIYGTALQSVMASATTVAPTKSLVHVSGTVAIQTITVPYTGFVGSITFIPDGLWTLTAGGNITVFSGGGIAVVDKPMIVTYDGTAWRCSY